MQEKKIMTRDDLSPCSVAIVDAAGWPESWPAKTSNENPYGEQALENEKKREFKGIAVPSPKLKKWYLAKVEQKKKMQQVAKALIAGKHGTTSQEQEINFFSPELKKKKDDEIVNQMAERKKKTAEMSRQKYEMSLAKLSYEKAAKRCANILESAREHMEMKAKWVSQIEAEYEKDVKESKYDQHRPPIQPNNVPIEPARHSPVKLRPKPVPQPQPQPEPRLRLPSQENLFPVYTPPTMLNIKINIPRPNVELFNTEPYQWEEEAKSYLRVQNMWRFINQYKDGQRGLDRWLYNHCGTSRGVHSYHATEAFQQGKYFTAYALRTLIPKEWNFLVPMKAVESGQACKIWQILIDEVRKHHLHNVRKWMSEWKDLTTMDISNIRLAMRKIDTVAKKLREAGYTSYGLDKVVTKYKKVFARLPDSLPMFKTLQKEGSKNNWDQNRYLQELKDALLYEDGKQYQQGGFLDVPQQAKPSAFATFNKKKYLPQQRYSRPRPPKRSYKEQNNKGQRYHGRFRGRCHICKKIGHKAYQCWHNEKNQQKRNYTPNYKNGNPNKNKNYKKKPNYYKSNKGNRKPKPSTKSFQKKKFHGKKKTYKVQNMQLDNEEEFPELQAQSDSESSEYGEHHHGCSSSDSEEDQERRYREGRKALHRAIWGNNSVDEEDRNNKQNKKGINLVRPIMEDTEQKLPFQRGIRHTKGTCMWALNNRRSFGIGEIVPKTPVFGKASDIAKKSSKTNIPVPNKELPRVKWFTSNKKSRKSTKLEPAPPAFENRFETLASNPDEKVKIISKVTKKLNRGRITATSKTRTGLKETKKSLLDELDHATADAAPSKHRREENSNPKALPKVNWNCISQQVKRIATKPWIGNANSNPVETKRCYNIFNILSSTHKNFIMDSGSPYHIVQDEGTLEPGSIRATNVPLGGFTDGTFRAKKSGTLNFTAGNPGKEIKLNLKNVLVVPEATGNIISTAGLLKDNDSLNIWGHDAAGNAFVVTNSGEAHQIGNMGRTGHFILKEKKATVNMLNKQEIRQLSPMDWHKKLGHVCSEKTWKYVERVYKEELQSSPPWTASEFKRHTQKCAACIRGKGRQQPYAKTRTLKCKTSPFSHLAVDYIIWKNTSRTSSTRKYARYQKLKTSLIITDAFSGYTIARSYEDRSKPGVKVIGILKEYKKLYGVEPKSISCDNEFTIPP